MNSCTWTESAGLFGASKPGEAGGWVTFDLRARRRRTRIKGYDRVRRSGICCPFCGRGREERAQFEETDSEGVKGYDSHLETHEFGGVGRFGCPGGRHAGGGAD